MQRIAVLTLMTLTVLAASAQAADSWYASVHLGKGWKGDADMDFTMDTAYSIMDPRTGAIGPWFTLKNHFHADLSYSSGWGVGASVGRGFGNWRIEGELFWRKSKVGGFHLHGYDFMIDPPDAPTFGGPSWDELFSLENIQEQVNETTVDLSGNVSLFSTVLNLVYDLPVQWPLQPYVGAGLGAVHADKSKRVMMLIPPCSAAQPCVADDSHKRSWNFTWQALAGVRYPVADKWNLTLGWRYASLSNLQFALLEDAEALGRISSDTLLQVQLDGMHSVELGIIRRF